MRCDAGMGTFCDATIEMEMSSDAVLLNSNIAMSKDPIIMSKGMKHGVIAGRNAYEAKRMKLSIIAIPSSNKKNALS